MIKMSDEECLAKYSVGLTDNFAVALNDASTCGAEKLFLRLGFLRHVHSCLRKRAAFYMEFRTWATPDDRKISAARVETLLAIHMELGNVKAFAESKDLFAVDAARRLDATQAKYFRAGTGGNRFRDIVRICQNALRFASRIASVAQLRGVGEWHM